MLCQPLHILWARAWSGHVLSFVSQILICHRVSSANTGRNSTGRQIEKSYSRNIQIIVALHLPKLILEPHSTLLEFLLIDQYITRFQG